jgi:hypothetical protein
MQKFDPNIGFWEKRNFFRRKLSKFAENCYHDIDPWMGQCYDFKNIYAENNWPFWLKYLLDI